MAETPKELIERLIERFDAWDRRASALAAQVAPQSPAPLDDEPFELDRLAQEQPRLLRRLAQIVGSRDLYAKEPDDGGWTQLFAPAERRRIARMLNEIAATSPPRAQEWYEYPTTDDVMNHLRAARKRRTARDPR